MGGIEDNSKIIFLISEFLYLNENVFKPLDETVLMMGQKYVFSSPEHKVLKVSYCDHPVSGVRRQSSVVCRQQFIQSTSAPKLLDQFQNNFTQMFP